MENSELDHLFSGWIQKIEETQATSDKLSLAIEFMKASLSNGQKARFRDFWRMKKICLELFKKEIPKSKRVVFWEEYTTLLTQAHSLQTILEEQSCFQSEQISLAIEGLEKELEKGPSGGSNKYPYLNQLAAGEKLIQLQKESLFYENLKQQALSYRKEILGLEIRISLKNKLLVNLSKLSDIIFPKRKELLLTLTKEFTELVEDSMTNRIDYENKSLRSDLSYFQLREEIKAFQGALKEVSIANEAYKKIRGILADSWDIVCKCEEEEKKRKLAAPLEITEELEKIKQAGSADFFKLIEGMLEKAKKRGVSREAFFLLKKTITEKLFLLETQKAEERKLAQAEKNKQSQKKEKEIEEGFNALESLKNQASSICLETLMKKYEEICQSLSSLMLNQRQQLFFNHKKELIETLIAEKRETLGEEVEETLAFLYGQMKQTFSQLKELKAHSGLDIEFALALEKSLQQTKEALELIEGKF